MPAVDSLHDLALLADAHAAALVGRDGAVVWCCLPRFDGGSCFASLLDPNRGGVCAVEDAGGPLEPVSVRYLEGTLVHEATLAGPHGELRVVDALVPGEGPRRLVRVLECTRG